MPSLVLVNNNGTVRRRCGSALNEDPFCISSVGRVDTAFSPAPEKGFCFVAFPPRDADYFDKKAPRGFARWILNLKTHFSFFFPSTPIVIPPFLRRYKKKAEFSLFRQLIRWPWMHRRVSKRQICNLVSAESPRESKFRKSSRAIVRAKFSTVIEWSRASGERRATLENIIHGDGGCARRHRYALVALLRDVMRCVTCGRERWEPRGCIAEASNTITRK